MGNIKKRPVLFFYLLTFVLLFTSCDDQSSRFPLLGINNAENPENESGVNEGTNDTGTEPDINIHTALTEDNVEIKLLRYRPSPDAPFNIHRQPVLMLGGIFMNNDEYLPHTTELMREKYSGMSLPDDLADWAVGDAYIQNDHLLYYNLGYYLWKKGFDPWFGNYRGTGRDEMKSGSPTTISTLDVPGCLDMPAMVQKITEVTGLKPVIGGHSTGGLVCWTYLQGAYIDGAEAIKGRNSKPRYIPHVKVSRELAEQRNGSVKGFIALDPAVAPYLPREMNAYWMWYLIDAPIVLPLDDMMGSMLAESGSDDMTMTEIMSYLFGGLSGLGIQYPESVFQYFDFFRTSNVDPCVLDYFMRYATTNGYMRMIAQFADWGIHVHMREGFNNGPENAGSNVMPEERKDGDGFLYYEDHMINITAPIICVGSASDGMQITDRIKELLINAKTPHELDTVDEVPGSAHADLPIGYSAPTILFPMLNEWLNQL